LAEERQAYDERRKAQLPQEIPDLISENIYIYIENDLGPAIENRSQRALVKRRKSIISEPVKEEDHECNTLKTIFREQRFTGRRNMVIELRNSMRNLRDNIIFQTLVYEASYEDETLGGRSRTSLSSGGKSPHHDGSYGHQTGRPGFW
jgi:hypothetical protein